MIIIQARHKNICQKSKKKDANRKPFDMAKQRAIGTELEAFMSMKKYNQTPADRVKQLAYERVSRMKVGCIILYASPSTARTKEKAVEKTTRRLRRNDTSSQRI